MRDVLIVHDAELMRVDWMQALGLVQPLKPRRPVRSHDILGLRHVVAVDGASHDHTRAPHQQADLSLTQPEHRR